MRRVAIIGSGGAGKSTLARELGEITGLPVIHLDREYWRPRWTETPKPEWKARVEKLVKGDEWIIDGNFGGTMEIRLAAADTVIFLDFPRVLCTYRAIKRAITYRNRTRPDMGPGCNEKFDLEFLRWVWQFPGKTVPTIEARIARLGPDVDLIRLHSPKEVEAFLVEVRGRAAVTCMEVRKDEFTISTDRSRLEVESIHRFLVEESYWARERTFEQTRTAIENSICFGLYHGERQIGFARVVSDKATFAYVGDVYVIEEYRGRGLSKWLMRVIVEHPDLQGLRRWVLATRDAHGLYEQFEFAPLRFPERWMEKTAPNAY